nr:hypothetical protein [Paraburkholderia fungorum]
MPQREDPGSIVETLCALLGHDHACIVGECFEARAIHTLFSK